MIIVTTENVPGLRVTASFGLVRGSSIRARHIGKDILAPCETSQVVKCTSTVSCSENLGSRRSTG